MADSAESTVRWRMPISGWVAIGLAVLALVFIFWLTSSRDLERLDAKAKGLGLTASWAELGLRLSPSDRLTDWRRLGQLTEVVKSYAVADGKFVSGQALPPELGQYHARLPVADLAELLALCDALPSEGLVLRTSCSYDTLYPELEWVRNCSKLLRERILLAPPEAVVSESTRMLAVISVRQPQLSLIEHLVSISSLAMWVQAVGWRLEHGLAGREALAAQADDARRRLTAGMTTAMDHEFLVWRTLAGEVHRGNAKAIADISQGFGGYGLGRTFMRAARGGFLDLLLDSAHGWRTAADYNARCTAIAASEARLTAMLAVSPARVMGGMIMPARSLINDSWMKIDTALLVLAAELRGQPWPADPTDPKGLAIRRIERGGRLIGCYLLGSDHADGGGRIKGDLCIQLYDRLGSERAADPPKDP